MGAPNMPASYEDQPGNLPQAEEASPERSTLPDLPVEPEKVYAGCVPDQPEQPEHEMPVRSSDAAAQSASPGVVPTVEDCDGNGSTGSAVSHSPQTCANATEPFGLSEYLNGISGLQYVKNFNEQFPNADDGQSNDEARELFVQDDRQQLLAAIRGYFPAEVLDLAVETPDQMTMKPDFGSPYCEEHGNSHEQKDTSLDPPSFGEPPFDESARQKRTTKPGKSTGKSTRPRRKTAREQAVKRHEKERREFKEHVRKEMASKGPDVSPQDIDLPQPKKRRNRSGGAAAGAVEEEADGGLSHIQANDKEIVVARKRRHEEIAKSVVTTGLSNRHTATQRADLQEAIGVFGFNKVSFIEKDGESLYRLAGMKALLKKWQLVAVSWMVKRETHIIPPYGGILADVPGMGKTIVSLAAVVGNPPTREDIEASQAATLIVLPNSTVLNQWVEQIHAHVHITGNPYIYKRSQNQLGEHQLGGMHLVLTTYSELQRSYPSQKLRQKIREKHSREVGDGSGEVIVNEPAYEAELDHHIGVLFRVKWYRVVLDEVHQIKNYDSHTCFATEHLQAKHFWGLSGTPLINGAMELFPYLRVIRYEEEETQERFEAKYLKSNEAKEEIDALIYLITYRRTHDDLFLGQKMLSLPVSHAGDQWVTLSAEERIIYDLTSLWFEDRALAKVALLHRQRQAVSHPYMLESFFRRGIEADFLRQYIDELSKVEGKKPVYLQIGNWIDRHILEESGEPRRGIATDRPYLRPFGRSPFGSTFKMTGLLELAFNEKTLEDTTCGICKVDGPICNPVVTKECKHIFCAECVADEMDKHTLSGPCAMKCPTCDADWKGRVELETLDTSKEKVIEANIAAKKNQSNHKNSTKRNVKRRRPVREQEEDPGNNSVARRPGEDSLGFKPAFGECEGEFFTKAVHSDEYGGKGVPAPGAKVTAVKDTVLRWQEEDPEHKGIIFTQFIMTSQIIGQMLQLEGIEFVYLNGKVTPHQKITAVKAFWEKPEIKYMIASMRCGGQALNLTCANRVIMVDVWWNKAAEEQAFGRVFRLGQVKETHYVRILARKTVDERIRDLQDSKEEEISRVLQDDGHVLSERSEWAILHRLYPDNYFKILKECMDEIRDEMAKGKGGGGPEPEKGVDDGPGSDKALGHG